MAVPGVVQGNFLQGGGAAPIQGSAPNLQPAVDPGRFTGWGGSSVPAQTYTAQDGSTYGSAGAAAARNSQINAARDTGMLGRGGALSGAQSSVNSLENALLDKVTPFVRKVQAGVENINQGNANNLLNLRRTNQGIAGDVRTGNRSLGVRLANMNALDSGAAIAGARAYAQAGNSQTQDARNQATLKEQELTRSAEQLKRERDDAILSFNQFRNVSVDSLGRELENQLAAIHQQAVAAGVRPDFFNVINDKNSVTDDAFRRLNEITNRRDAELAAAKFLTPEEAQALAVQMDAAGAAANPFAVGDIMLDTPEGPALGQLPPLAPARRDEDSVLNPAVAVA